MVEIAREVFILFSLAFTVPTLTGTAVVAGMYRRQAWLSWRKAPKDRDQAEWLILGIDVSFAGSFIDNLYWGIAWMALYYNLASADALFLNGVFCNLIFRQSTTAYAAHCHVRATKDARAVEYLVGVKHAWKGALGLFLFLAFTGNTGVL